MKKLILSERTNLFEPNDYIYMYAKLQNIPEPQNVTHAVKQALAANETTMSQIKLEPDGMAYYEKRKQSGCKIIHANHDWKTVICENERIPFELWNGELMRIFLWENGQILLMAHHLAGDGKSICIFLQDILDSLNGKELTYKPAHILTYEELNLLAKFPFYIKHYIASLNRTWDKTKRIFNWNDYQNIHTKYWSKYQSSIEISQYSTHETSDLIQHCHDIGITVNSYMATSIAAHHPSVKLVGIPIDVRDEIADQTHINGMTNLVSGARFPFHYKSKKSLDQNSITFHNKLQKIMVNNNRRNFILPFMSSLDGPFVDSLSFAAHGLLDNKLCRKTAKAFHYSENDTTNLGITNLNIINFSGTNYQFKDFIFIPPAVTYSDFIYGICTYNGKLVQTQHVMKRI